ncbi:hypothetical protein EI94DRAFT_1762683 [Lactarius quietus]|nr:hypothetical protein EI94DRAFT_1762683 [Lactarius quietus]
MLQLAGDVSDPQSQRAAFSFLSKSVGVWGQPLPDRDGQVLVVLQEIAGLLQTIGKVRGEEAYTFFVSVFLPAQNWPAETALEFTTKIRDLDSKQFRKYFAELVRTSRSGS